MCQWVCRALVRSVAYVGSLLKERCLRSVQGACSFAWLMSDLCFSELMRFIFYSTDREATRPLVRLDNFDAVPSQLMRCIFDSKTLHVKSRQLLRFTSCEKYFSTRIMLTVLDMTDTKGPYNQQTYYNETEQILKCWAQMVPYAWAQTIPYTWVQMVPYTWVPMVPYTWAQMVPYTCAQIVPYTWAQMVPDTLSHKRFLKLGHRWA